MGKLIRFPRKSKLKDERARPLFPPFKIPLGSTDAHRARVPSDAAPDLPREGQPIDPEVERKLRLRRTSTIAAFVLLFAVGVAAALFGDHGYLDVRRQTIRLGEMQKAYDDHLKRVKDLESDIKGLKTESAPVERIAREQLGMTAKGEVTLLLPGGGTSPFLDPKPESAIVPPASSTERSH
ncbi:MAG TPA: septum formation initiator family protein [Candidatus Polarisedimenticolaceae bacterium]|nr:septum formation initiator family protein [Candidatus Polarisedimenticolaceae bacterium]